MRRRITRALRGLFGAPTARAGAIGPGFPSVELVWWRPPDGSVNFGDALSRVVVSRMLAERGHDLEEQVSAPRRLLAIGSILHFARDGDVVWGSGVNGKIEPEAHRFASLDVRAVRGPRTAAFLRARGIRVPDVFGDPALLVPSLFPGRFERAIREECVVVPNLHDLGRLSREARVVSPLLGWNEVVRRVAGARRVVASSLHGIVLADAFGVPVNYLRVSESEGLFKYEDHVLGTGRDRLPVARSVEEALASDPMPPARFDVGALRRAFPFELWNQPAADAADNPQRRGLS